MGRVRSDIQVLRGVAILMVVLLHAFPYWFPYGYLGVDLFFVISGFLMTKMIVRPDFTFSGFYLRRARRLLPASFATLAVSTVAGWLILSPDQWRSFAIDLFGALTFSANITSLFQGASPNGVYPLRAYWSLSLEEQFYFVYPLLLVFAPKKWVIILTVLSFAGWLIVGGSAAFYLLPFRAWELLLGGVLYLGGFTKPTPLRFKPLEVVGDWSYSLYLVHWPILAFAGALYGGWPLPPLVALALCFFALALSALQYEFVEQPFRSRRRGRAEVGKHDGGLDCACFRNSADAVARGSIDKRC